MENNKDSGSGLKVSSQYDALFQSFLSPQALAIRQQHVPSTRFKMATPLIKGRDMETLDMQMLYFGFTITGKVEEKHVKHFAEEINQLAAQGWIEYGCLTPMMDMKLAKLWVGVDGKPVPGQFGAYFEKKPEYTLSEDRTMLLFYVGSRYSLQEMKMHRWNQVKGNPFPEGGLPPAYK